MGDHGMKDIDELLKNRSYVPPRLGMTKRIVARAISEPPRGSWLHMFHVIWEEGLVQKPVFAVAIFLMMGFLMGVEINSTYKQDSASGQQDSLSSIQSYLYAEEVLG